MNRSSFIRETAKKAGVSRKAVRRVLKQGPGFHPSAPAYQPRPSKLDPYKAKIGVLVREEGLSAVRVLEEIQELGFEGKYTIVKDYVRTIRPTPYKRPTPPLIILREKKARWTGVPIPSFSRDDGPAYRPLPLYCASADGFITAILRIKPLKASSSSTKWLARN